MCSVVMARRVKCRTLSRGGMRDEVVLRGSGEGDSGPPGREVWIMVQKWREWRAVKARASQSCVVVSVGMEVAASVGAVVSVFLTVGVLNSDDESSGSGSGFRLVEVEGSKSEFQRDMKSRTSA